MSLGSVSRAREDALRFQLKRRLSRLDTAEHLQYIELESARIVETLRSLRDVYRSYLRHQGCTPLVEVYWVVLRFGVKDWAVMVLRSAAFTYLNETKIKAEQWKRLFEVCGPMEHLSPAKDRAIASPSDILSDNKLKQKIEMQLHQDVFDEVLTGGPFGESTQVRPTRSYPGPDFLLQREDFQSAIERRLAFWNNCKPWTEGLARLFDAAQEELFYQSDAFGIDARREGAGFLKISKFEEIAYKHLEPLRDGEIATAGATKDRWLPLLAELDEKGIVPEHSLEGIARKCWVAVRQKGVAVATWKECYASTARIMLEDGKNRTLRREVTLAIHNAARNAANQLSKIWGH